MTNKKFSVNRRLILIGLVAATTVPALQGCFPIAAGGATGAALIFSDRRTSGAYVEDEGIEWRARTRISERFGNAVNVSVTSFNRNVLLTGQVPDEATKAEAGRIAAAVENVRGIVNELEVRGLSPLASRSNDAVITSMVKARFVDANSFSANHVKVVTEWSTVYLLGLVTRAEADAATDVARNTRGVAKVVRVFEYITEAEAARLDRRAAQEEKK